MARSQITAADILPKLPSKLRFSGTANTGKLLGFQVQASSPQDLEQRFQNAILRASERITVDLGVALRAALGASVWTTLSGTDDIVDTGNLLNSGSVTYQGERITIAYSAPYAALVHFGGYINPFGNTNARVYLPPRPWVDSVLNGGGPVPQFDFETYYNQELRAEFSS
jgi:hypothetical protein